MTALLICILFFLFLVNAPVAVAIGATSVIGFILQTDIDPALAVQRMYAGTDSFPLMAVPLFMIAGVLMTAGGISQRIIQAADSLVGHLPGGTPAVAVVAAMFFAGISGSAAADTAAVGAVLIPAMIKDGYSPDYAASIQASGGSIGVIIPPSIPMIIFGVLTGASIADLFAAGILPGLLMGFSLILTAVFLSGHRNRTHEHGFQPQRVLASFIHAFWALITPVVILGGILGGIFTATESAAVAVFYAFIIGKFVYNELSFRDIPRLLVDASVTSGVVMFIIASASAFSWLMAVEQVPQTVASHLLSTVDNKIVLLLLINALLLIAGAFIETTAALLLFVPVIVPMLPALGIGLVQLGVIITVNLAIGMLTPPLGICLIVSSSLSGSRLENAAKSVLPFLLILLVDLLFISFLEPLTGFLPSLLR